MNQVIVGRWFASLDQYNFSVVHRPQVQLRNEDGLRKRKNDHLHREKMIKEKPKMRKKLLTQREVDELPTLPYISMSIQYKIIPTYLLWSKQVNH